MTQRLLTFVFTVMAATICSSAVFAQTDTIFTYQGELNQNGSPVNGVFNMDISLWDAESGGNLLDAVFTPVIVGDGKFTVPLDFGAEIFDNANRWIQIEVNGSILTPRQQITRCAICHPDTWDLCR